MSALEQVWNLLDHGCTMLVPAGRYARFTLSAAESMIGTFTWFEASEFGISHRARMEVVRAELVDDGRAMRVTFRPPELDQRLPWLADG